MAKRFKSIGAAIVTWTDACWMVHVEALENVAPIMQKSIGLVYLDRKQNGLIIVQNINESGDSMELTFVPAAWVQDIAPLEPSKKLKQPVLTGGAK